MANKDKNIHKDSYDTEYKEDDYPFNNLLKGKDSLKHESLNFVFLVITAIISLLYTIYHYVSENALNQFLIILTYHMFVFGVVICTCLIIFVLFKHMSFEIDDINIQKQTENLASAIYAMTFLISAAWILFALYLAIGFYNYLYVGTVLSKVALLTIGVLLTFIFPYLAIKKLFEKSNLKLEIPYVYVIVFGLIYSILEAYMTNDKFFYIASATLALILLGRFLLPKIMIRFDNSWQPKNLNLSTINNVFILYVYILATLALVSSASSLFFVDSSFIGTIDIENDASYCEDVTYIPVNVNVKGANANLMLYLFKSNSNNTFEKVDELLLKPNHSLSSPFNSKVMFGNYVSNGKYLVYVNVSNQDFGYYELRCNYANNEITRSISGFVYLK